jgi:hypothetical protein
MDGSAIDPPRRATPCRRYCPVVTTASPSGVAPAFATGPGSPPGWGWYTAGGPSQLQSPAAGAGYLRILEAGEQQQPQLLPAGPLRYTPGSGPLLAASPAAGVQACGDDDTTLFEDDGPASEPPGGITPGAATVSAAARCRAGVPPCCATLARAEREARPKDLPDSADTALQVGTSPFASQPQQHSCAAVQEPAGPWGAGGSRRGSDGDSSGPELEGAAELLRGSQVLRGGLGQSELDFLDGLGAGWRSAAGRPGAPAARGSSSQLVQQQQQQQPAAAGGGAAGEDGDEDEDGVLLGDSTSPHKLEEAVQGCGEQRLEAPAGAAAAADGAGLHCEGGVLAGRAGQEKADGVYEDDFE